MGKGHDWRPPRRRGLDDDSFMADPPRRSGGRTSFGGPRPMLDERPMGPPTTAVVKWFNPEKAFGFVALSDGSGDAFLHLSALERAGHGPVAPGTTLQVRVSQGQKGAQVSEVLEVDTSTATAAPAPRDRSMGGRPSHHERDAGPAVEMFGTVKWYNAAKGFGFVVTAEGGKDVFVHASVLEREGISGLNEGQGVRMQVAQGRKGPEAVSIKLA
jgi:cold shock protein